MGRKTYYCVTSIFDALKGEISLNLSDVEADEMPKNKESHTKETDTQVFWFESMGEALVFIEQSRRFAEDLRKSVIESVRI